MKNISRILLTVLLSALSLTCFYSCQKADLNPYGGPGNGQGGTVNITPADTTPSFQATIKNSIFSFTPTKYIVGSNTYLKGVSTYYTIYLIFPNSTAPGGSYDIGFPSTTISAKLINGSTTYVDDYRNGVGGSLTIDSISAKGKYYGSFNFDALDSISYNDINVTQGTFYHL